MWFSFWFPFKSLAKEGSPQKKDTHMEGLGVLHTGADHHRFQEAIFSARYVSTLCFGFPSRQRKRSGRTLPPPSRQVRCQLVGG